MEGGGQARVRSAPEPEGRKSLSSSLADGERHEHPLGVVTVWGQPSGSTEAFVDTYARRGPEGVASWAGSWSSTLSRTSDTRLFVATDAFAGVPLFLNRGNASTDFGRLVQRRPTVCKAAVRRHLDFDFDAPSCTWIEGIHRVPAGYGGWTAPERTRLARIWSPDHSPAPSDPVQELRRAVEQSINDRSPERGDTVALSGGLDSSILAGLLTQRGPFRAVSNRFEGWRADEGPFIEAVRRKTAIETLAVPSKHLDPLEVLALLAPPGPPPVIVNHHLNLALMEAGGRRLWTGFGGDEVAGHGFDIVRQEIAEGRPLRAAWDAAWLAARYSHETQSRARSFKRWGARWWYAMQDDHHRRDNPTRPRSDVGRRLEWMTSPVIARSREEQLRLAHVKGIELLMPFLDTRIAEVMMRIPTRHRVKRGLTRAIVRESFADVLPAEVRGRGDKADLCRSFDEPFAAAADIWGPELETGLLDPWIGANERKALRADFDAGDSSAGAALWRALGATRWLTWLGERP